MHSHPDASPRRRAARAASVIVPLAALAWLFGTPVLGYLAAIMSASFFGDTPSADQLATAERLGLAALGCAFAAPTVALAFAVLARWRATAWACAGALTLSVGALAYLAAR